MIMATETKRIIKSHTLEELVRMNITTKATARCFNEFGELPFVNNDSFQQSTIADYVFAAQLEVDLYEDGENPEATKADISRIKKFIAKWSINGRNG